MKKNFKSLYVVAAIAMIALSACSGQRGKKDTQKIK